MICQKCGTQLPDNAKFCTNCGNTVDTTEQYDIRESQQITKQKRKKPNTALSILCCILIFVFSFLTFTVFTVRHSLDSDSIETFMTDLDIKEIAKDLDLDEEIISNDPKVIKKLYNRTFIGDFIEDYVEDYAEFILGEERFEEVDVNEVINKILHERYQIEQITGTELTNEDIDYIYNTLYYEVEEGALSKDVLAGDEVSTAKVFVSPYIAILLAALTLVFIFLLIKSRRFNISSMIWTSVPLLCASILFAIIFTIKPIILSFLSALGPVVAEIAGTYMSAIFGFVLICSLIIIALCIILIVIHNIIKKRKANI